MIRAAEQIFEQNDEYSSLIWIAYPQRSLIFLIHEYGWWKGFPDLWAGEPVEDPHPGTERGFAYLIEKAGLGSLLGTPRLPEQPFQTEVATKPFQTEKIRELKAIRDGTYWEFSDGYGRALKLFSPGMNWHVEYP